MHGKNNNAYVLDDTPIFFRRKDCLSIAQAGYY